MIRNRFSLLAFSLVLISLSNTGTHAQTRIADHFLRDRSVRRIQPSRISLPVFSSAAADAFPAKQKPVPEAAAGGTKLDFFSDVSMVVDWTDVVAQSGDAVAWYGRVQGAPYGQATFVRTGDQLIGSATRGDGKVYQVRTAEDGTQWNLEIDQSLLPDETDPIEAAPVPATPPAVTASDAVADDGSTIDVLVLYTPAARQVYGKTELIEAQVQLAIAVTNQGYAASGVIQRVRLVNTQEINYVESSRISDDLTNLRSGNGVLAQAQTLRDTYGADLVSLWVDTPENTCGIGYILNPSLPAATMASLGFSVAERKCAVDNYTFAHEMGHNMGAHHAKDDLNPDGTVPSGAYPYSNGYKQKTGPNRFRTIMAYDGDCGCPRINYWSNPNVTVSGLPTGIDPNALDSAANYLTLNKTAQLVANFRASVVGPPPGGTDSTGPLLSTSPTSGQTVFSTSITISGTATDAGRGDNGISSVTVNGVRASGDTASGVGIATWSRTLTLNTGVNAITVVATDGSTSQNTTTTTLSITLSIPTSATASTYHVFPQFADGRAADGSYYRTTLMVANPSSTTTANCTFRLYGLTPNLQSTYTFNFLGSGWTVLPFTSNGILKSGYATLQCSATVEAQLLYSFYSAAGAKMSEATVFSSPPAGTVQVLGDNRGGSQIAIAIANDSDASRTYTIAAYDSAGSLVPGGSTTRTLPARTNLAAFVRDLVSLPTDYFGQVIVTSGSGTASMIGIRFTGIAFTTIPAVNRSALGATASTYHVFPQFADGRAGDGTYYRTTVMIVNSSSTSGTCTLRLYGLTVNGGSTFNYGTFPAGSWTITTSISSMQDLRSGYAALQCGMPVEAQLLYSFYTASGTKISEATVFSSPPGGSVQVLADNRDASSLAIAIANDSDQVTSYTITAYNSSGIPVGSVTQPIAGRSNLARFLSNLISLPPNHYGPVLVTSSGGSASIIGIRFTGGVFTTIPEAIR